MPIEEVDYTKRYTDAVNHTVSYWKERWEGIHPKRNDCMPVIQAKANQILAEISKLQLKLGETGPYDFIGSRLVALNLYADVCIGTQHALPKDLNLAIEDLERQIIIHRTSSDLARQVVIWEKRFAQANSKSSDCAPLVQGKARILLNQLQQLNVPPEDLRQARRNGMQYLETYAARCLNEGAAAVRDLELPKPYYPPQPPPDPNPSPPAPIPEMIQESATRARESSRYPSWRGRGLY